MDDEAKLEKKDKFTFTVGVLIVFLIVISSSFLFYQSKNIENGQGGEVKSEPEQQSPVVTEKPLLDYKNIKIQVLNASKIKGLAKKYADILTESGYKQVEIGNTSEEVSENTFYAPSNDSTIMKTLEINDYEYKESEIVKILVVN